MRRGNTNVVALAEPQVAKFGLTDARCSCQYCLENGLQLARRARNDVQHLRRRRLLLQCFVQLARSVVELFLQASGREPAIWSKLWRNAAL